MSKTKAWIKAFRLRTLPLSFSNIILGTALASIDFDINYVVFGLILGTTLLLQIVSNLANDYGDAKKGTDNEKRVGPERAVQSGMISLRQMKTGILITSTLAFISGIALLYVAFDGEFNYYSSLFLALGIGAIAAAIKYTVGKKAYGYSGMGDLFVFIFFGLVGVLGTYYLLTQSFEWITILPAITMGTISTAVLNLNNMRDIDNDREMNKNTLVVKMGSENAKKYHYSLFFWGYVAYITYCLLKFNLKSDYLVLTPLLLVGIIHTIHLLKVSKTKTPKDFDPELKKIALSALLFAGLVWGSIFLIIK
jgi:1,4-dihydroxy-2-naphthoate octaprenyltransferase